MRKFLLVISAFITLFVLSSCIKEDKNGADCEQKIIIEFDWSLVVVPDETEMIELAILDEARSSFKLEVNNQGTEVNLDAHEYEFVADEPREFVEVTGTTVTVLMDENGDYHEPDLFTGGAIDAVIEENLRLQVVTIPMRYQVRPLIIRVILNGEMIHLCSHIETEISGVAFSRHINNGFPPLDEQPLHPAYITDSVEYDLEMFGTYSYSDRKNLLGIDGDSNQIVTFHVCYLDETKQEVKVNVTDRMYGFHTDHVREPWVLEFIVNVDTDPDAEEINNVRVTIQDWQGGYESSLVAYQTVSETINP